MHFRTLVNSVTFEVDVNLMDLTPWSQRRVKPPSFFSLFMEMSFANSVKLLPLDSFDEMVSIETNETNVTTSRGKHATPLISLHFS